LRWRGTCYRAHDPRWAWAPTSGAGAAAKGGRFNPIGVEALYLALTVKGMFLEMAHGFARRFEPLTVCCYDVDVEDVIDLRTHADRVAARIELADLACPWAYDLARGKRPASWRVAQGLIAAGASGILTRSFAAAARADMANLTVWKWGREPPHKVEVFDPSGRLPKGQLSR
jgi:RES domain-containing protein